MRRGIGGNEVRRSRESDLMRSGGSEARES